MFWLALLFMCKASFKIRQKTPTARRVCVMLHKLIFYLYSREINIEKCDIMCDTIIKKFQKYKEKLKWR